MLPPSPSTKTFVNIDAPLPGVLELGKHRLIVVFIVFICVFGLIAFRLISISLLHNNQVAVAEVKPVEEVEALPSHYSRAEIMDRDERLLAINLMTASLYANPEKMLDVDDAVKKLASVLPNLDMKALKKRLQSEKQFVWIKRNLTPKKQNEVNMLGIPGVYFEHEEKRIYPQRELFSHAIGYVSVDGRGLAGIEKSFDSDLRYNIHEEKEKEALQLTLDTRVQNVVHDALAESIREFKAIGGSGVVLDVNTGEVLAMVSLPDFDPNLPGGGGAAHMFNQATLGMYEMGSTFKTFTMAMALEEKAISLEDQFDVSKPIYAARFAITDYHPKIGKLSVPEIFMYSSNIGTATIAMKVGGGVQQRFLKKLGLLDVASIEVPEKGVPLYPKTWGDISTMTVSYGHGVAVSPIHITQATAALVNGGMLYPARLVYKEGATLVGREVVSPETSAQIRKLLRYVVQSGTGKAADARGYMVGGKTGTADKANNGMYKDKSVIVSFMGVFPIHDPKYAVFVMVDEPRADKTMKIIPSGGTVAAPMARNIIARIGPLLNVMPVHLPPSEEEEKELHVKSNENYVQTISF